MDNVSFSVCIYPSLTRGGYVVSITNDSCESLVLGHTNNVDQVKRSFQDIFNVSDHAWSYDKQLKYHTLKIMNNI